jgi:hypothetical protein
MDVRLDKTRDHEFAGEVVARGLRIDAWGDLGDASPSDADVHDPRLTFADARTTQDEVKSHEPSISCAYGRQWNRHNAKSAGQFNTSHRWHDACSN